MRAILEGTNLQLDRARGIYFKSVSHLFGLGLIFYFKFVSHLFRFE
jgi:hypothetical protein